MINTLRTGEPAQLGHAFAGALDAARSEWNKPAPEADKPVKPAYAPPRRKPSKFRLWLVAHGLKFERTGDINHRGNSYSIIINHRVYGVDLAFILKPFIGVFADELNTRTPRSRIA